MDTPRNEKLHGLRRRIEYVSSTMHTFFTGDQYQLRSQKRSLIKISNDLSIRLMGKWLSSTHTLTSERDVL